MGAAGLAATTHPHKAMNEATMHKRLACADGRAILRDHGYYRVKSIDCHGGTYTYVGYRHGTGFRVLVSAHTGRILKAHTV